MYGNSPDHHRFVDSSGEITFSELSSAENTRPNSSSTQQLTPGPSYSESSDPDSGPSPNKPYSRPSHFVSQDSIIVEDDEDYEVMSDNEVEESTAANSPLLPTDKTSNLALADDDMSCEGDADDEGEEAGTDNDRSSRRQPPQTPSKSKECLDSGLASSFPGRALTSPMTPRRSHREQMNELSALFEGDSNKHKKEHGRSKSGDTGSTTPLPTSLLKYIRKWSKEKSEGIDTSIGNLPTAAGEHDDDSIGRDAGSDELPEDTDDDDLSLDDLSSDWVYPAANGIDWNGMPSLPLQFHTLEENPKRQRTPHYLDAAMLSAGITIEDADRFAWEHAMLLQAVLQLLAERDQVGVEGSIDSGDNIWKKGPLKRLSSRGGKSKLSAQWKVKYVELRHGNLCYYEDSGHGRKMIHLRQSDAEVKLSPPSKSHPGFVFELSVLGASTSYWMANSEEERQAWIKSIQSAMLGSVVPRRDVDLAPHQEALMAYKGIKDKVSIAETRDQYLEAVTAMVSQEEAVRVPVDWVTQQLDEQPRLSESQLLHRRAKTATSAHKELQSSIVEFWKKLDLISFGLNGISIHRSTPLASERLVGALTRSFLEFDKVVADEEQTAPELTELQAVAYARNILLAVIRNRDENYAFHSVSHLFDNPNLAVVPATENAEHIVYLEVSGAGEELPDDVPRFDDEMTGWLWVRKVKQPTKSRKKRYAVMSGAVLSLYEAALPRPNGLRGQTVLTGATFEHEDDDEPGDAVEHYCLTIHSRKEDLVLSFESEDDFAHWKESIQDQIDLPVTAFDSSSTALHPLDDTLDASIISTYGLGFDSAIQEGEYEGENVEMSSELALKHHESHEHRKSTMLGSSASRLSRAAGKTAGKIADTAGKVAETAGKAAGKMAGTAGKAAGKVAGTAGKLTDEGIRIAKSTAAGSLRSSIRVAKGAISKTPGVNVVRGAVGRTVGRLRSTNKETSAEDMDFEVGSLKKRPSMQMLLSNTALADKREPTVQCVVQESQLFRILTKDNNDIVFTVQAKLYQAFLLRGGPSGRMAQGDAVIQIDHIEAPVDDMDDDSDEDVAFCALPEALWRTK